MRHAALLPLACYAVLFGYAGYGWWMMGHWPYYAHPDPKELPRRVLLSIATVAFIVGALFLVLIPIAYAGWRGAASWRKRPTAPHRKTVLWYSAGLAVWVLDMIPEFTDAPWSSNISWLLD
jgi:hypothetical protein